jgi:predicted short-subunit dehydrogenase-like oxidoreductase (DUF2520 family)
MISVVIVGTGNVAQNLYQAFEKSNDVTITQVIGRNREHLTFVKNNIAISTTYNEIAAADIYILAISDDAIKLVAESFKDVDGIVAHTSGATSLEALQSAKRPGIF